MRALFGLVALTACAHAPVSPELRASLAAPAPDEGLRWLGAAGFELRTANTTVLFDPFLSRPSLGTVLFGRVVPDRPLLDEAVPRADLILIGHSHYDHLMDAPAIAERTGAAIVGTETTCRLVKALAPKARCATVRPLVPAHFGGLEIVAVPSRHASSFFGVPFRGRLVKTPRFSTPHAKDFVVGEPLIWIVKAAGRTIVHVSSAELPDDASILPELLPKGADLVLAATALAKPEYGRKLAAQLRPRRVIAHHFDPLFDPLGTFVPHGEAGAALQGLGGAELIWPTPGAWLAL